MLGLGNVYGDIDFTWYLTLDETFLCLSVVYRRFAEARDALDCGGASWQGVTGKFPVLSEGQLGNLKRLDLEMACTRFSKGSFLT
jgi:hypothetical protein